MTLIAYIYRKLQTANDVVREVSKKSHLRKPFDKRYGKQRKYCWNIHNSSYIMFIGHYESNWVGKRLSYWYAKSQDCLLTHWLLMRSILFLVNQFNVTKSDRFTYNSKNPLSIFLCNFEIYNNFWTFRNKRCISEITDSERSIHIKV